MTGYNLPPGCNVSDIPGHRPEDMIWIEGAEAFDNGKLRIDNPYQPGSMEHSWWCGGFTQAETEYLTP